MLRAKIILLCLFFSLTLSCTKIKSNLNSVVGNNEPEKLRMPLVNLPKEVKNASPDAHIYDNNAVVVSVLPGSQFYIGSEASRERIEYRIDDLLKKSPSERQLLYLNADSNSEYGDIVEILYKTSKNDVTNIGLIVRGADNQLGDLKVKLEPQPNLADDMTSPPPNYLILNLQKDGKINFGKYDKDFVLVLDKQTINPADAGNQISQAIKEKADKTVWIRADRTSLYRDVVSLVDAAVGAGATVFLKINDLSDTGEATKLPDSTSKQNTGVSGNKTNQTASTTVPIRQSASTESNSSSAANAALNQASDGSGKIISGGVLNGRAISLPKPVYPPNAKAMHASGTVIVQVTVDETGKVISAVAASGHPLLRSAAVQAAYAARFAPQMLSGKAVKISGVINYDFVPE